MKLERLTERFAVFYTRVRQVSVKRIRSIGPTVYVMHIHAGNRIVRVWLDKHKPEINIRLTVSAAS